MKRLHQTSILQVLVIFGLCSQILGCDEGTQNSVPIQNKAAKTSANEQPSQTSLKENSASQNVKNTKVNSENTKYINDEIDNLSGTWECNTQLSNENCNFIWKINEDNTYKLYMNCTSGEKISNGKWKYSNNTLATSANGVSAVATIVWIDDNEFILKQNDIKRYYSRTNKKIP